jgi:glycosyltransferase involved in cell wall biosynthesis
LREDSTRLTITVVVPTYNSRHIEACLRSILNQTETKLQEVIVVDDASTDNTVETIREIQAIDSSQRIACIRLERNSGPSAAKNAGIQRASGTHIACIDSDMVLERDCIARLVDDSQDSGSIGTMAYFMVPREASALTRVIGYDLEFRLSRILRAKPWVEVGKLGTGATLFTKQSLLEAGLFDLSRRVGEDTALSYRLRELGGKLVISGRARCLHYWQSRGLRSYIGQQVGYGEGILQAYLDSRRIPPDPVSSPLLRFEALLAAISILALLISPFSNLFPWVALVAVLLQIALDSQAVLWIARRRRDRSAALLAPLAFLVRNYSWAASLVAVALRRITGRFHHSKISSV